MRPGPSYIIFFCIAFALLSASGLQAQDRCGTVEYSKTLYSNPALQRIGFERWMSERKAPSLNSGRQKQEQATPYRIPVVIHIIHNGEPIGVGANISDEQILSQIRVMNEDFNRQNADAANTPFEFLDEAGSIPIEFVLAKQNPDGLPSNGIVRVNGGRSSWTMNDNYTLKSRSYWAAEQYMNIWVCNLTDEYVGYAQFPESDLLGLENSSTNRLTDGIVIWHTAFGSADDGSFALDPAFNKGRTVTHEAGHFFGLNHIWGDDGSLCSGTDYVTDTPNQGGETSGCPTHPKVDGCGQVIMFQNFLDYSDDDCMNLFTHDQVSRMITVIENSPRRVSLLTSPGLLAPAPVANDVGIREIVFPDASVCSNLVTPVIELRNFGSNAITSARVRMILDGNIQETKDFTLSLAPITSAEVSFSAISISSGSHSITFQVLLTNGGTDGASYNNEKSSTVIVPAFGTAPFAENFNSPPAGWITQNPDGQITWQIVTAPHELPINKALKLNYFDYEDKVGEVDVYVSPVIDLTSAAAASMTFDVAHARYQLSNDRLKVIVLSNCQDISQGTVVFNKAGDSLKTAPSTVSAFTPTGVNQWRKELIDLSGFIGMDRVQLAFVGINDWGNNIYIDNVTLFTEQTRDVALVRLVNPSVVTCQEEVTPRILIQNTGSDRLNEMNATYSVDGGPVQSVSITAINLPFGEEKEIALPAVNLPGENIHSLLITLSDPNGFPDNNPNDNQKTFTIVVNQRQDRIPLRENFDGIFTPDWTAVNPGGGMNWATIATNANQSIYFNAFNNNTPGDEAWLVSPVLDFSRAQEARLLFDLSYADRANGETTLSILASTDCGNSYEELSYNFPSANAVSGSWIPELPEDWNRNIAVNLNSLAGQEDVRIAFVVRNELGNNLYLDSLEFFVTGQAGSVEISELYAVYGYDLARPDLSDLKIKFNLPERQDVRFSIISVNGQMETDGILTDVLNQTFPLNISHRLPAGVYVIRLKIGARFYSSRILVH